MADPQKLHIGIIPDGNRRWARAQGLVPWKGHERAVENFQDILEWCRKHPRIGTLTIWCFSTENWKRSAQEISALMKLFEEYLRKEQPKFHEQKTRFLHSGRRDRIPRGLMKLISELEADTKGHEGFTLHLAIDYGGKDEIVRAHRRLISAKIDPVTEESLRGALDHPELPDIDLVLRTSGETRTSNFFLWQSAYAEWIFTEKLFPEITVQDLEAALEEFDRRKRRFGG